MTVARFHFPNVDAEGRVEPNHFTCEGTGESLTPSEMARFGLGAVESAFAILMARTKSATVCWNVSAPPDAVHGLSGQLAAMLALVHAEVPRARLRRELSAAGEIWASARVVTGALAGRVLIGEVGGPPDSKEGAAFDRKVEEAMNGRARILLCALSDALRVRGRLVSADRVLTLDAFCAVLEDPRPSPAASRLVALRPWELERLCATLWDRLFPTRAEEMTVVIARPPTDGSVPTREGAQAIDAAVERLGGCVGLRHLLVPHASGHPALVLGCFTTPADALRGAVALATEGVTASRCAVGLRSGVARWAGRHLLGDLVDDALQLSAEVSPGGISTSEVEVARLISAGMLVRGRLQSARRLRARDGQYRMFSLSASHDAPVLLRDALHSLPHSRLGAAVACAFTLSRIPLGLLTAWLLIRGDVASALRVYVIGLGTDVVDGLVARKLNGETAWGKQYDGVIDTAFYWTATLGFVLARVAQGSLLGGSLPLVLTLLTLALTFWFEPYSEWYKYRGLANRSWVLVCMLPYLDASRDLTLLLLLGFIGVVGVAYEWNNTQQEIAWGLRGRGWRRSVMVPLPRHHRLLCAVQQRFWQAVEHVRSSSS